MQTRGPTTDPQSRSLPLSIARRFTRRTEGGSLQLRGAHRLGAPSQWNLPEVPWALCQPRGTAGCQNGECFKLQQNLWTEPSQRRRGGAGASFRPGSARRTTSCQQAR